MNTQTVLIVEDEVSIRRALKDKLEREKLNVIEASDGKIGLELALQKHPDLILMDILMPTMDGISALRLLRADPWGASAKVILLTNVNENEKLAEAMQAGVFEYIVKTDWKIENVVAKIREKLQMP